MTRPRLSVWIVDVLVTVNHRVKTIIHMTLIWKVIFCIFYVIGVPRGDNSSMEDAIGDGAMHEAFFVAQHFALVDVTRV